MNPVTIRGTDSTGAPTALTLARMGVMGRPQVHAVAIRDLGREPANPDEAKACILGHVIMDEDTFRLAVKELLG